MLLDNASRESDFPFHLLSKSLGSLGLFVYNCQILFHENTIIYVFTECQYLFSLQTKPGNNEQLIDLITLFSLLKICGPQYL